MMKKIAEVSEQLKAYIEEKSGLKAQYTVSETKTREITMEDGEFTLFRTLFDQSVDIKVIKDNRVGSASINKTDDDSLHTALDTAISSAESGTEDECFDIAPGMESAEFKIGVLEPDIDQLMQRAKELSEDIKKRHPKVKVMQMILSHVRDHSIYRNTNGSMDEVDKGYYEVYVEFAGNDGTNSTGIAGSAVDIVSLDRPLIELGSFDRDLQDAENSLCPVTVDGKFEGEVIFAPNCAMRMIYYALTNFAGDATVLDQTGLWLGKLGEKVVSEKLTIGMKPWDERIINHEVHTEDGFRSEDYTVIDKGVLKSYQTSLYTANKRRVDRAKNSGFDIVIEGGDTPYADMVKNMKRGLIVGAVSGGMPSGNGELSGVAKNSFYVENGEIKGAVMETMINCNLADMLNNVVAISQEVLCDGGMVMPYIGVDKVVISGK